MPTTDATTRTADAAWLADRLRAGSPPLVLDVRTPAEFESVHIPGAENVPLATLQAHSEEVEQHLGVEVVLVCRSGQRSEQAERALASAGRLGTPVLDGGMLAWESAGGPVVRGRQRWDMERQVRLVAGSIVATSVVGSAAFGPLKWVAAGIGGGLTFAAVSNSCAMGNMLARLPYNRAAGADPKATIEALAARSRRS